MERVTSKPAVTRRAKVFWIQVAKSRRLRIQSVNHVFPLTLTLITHESGRQESGIRSSRTPSQAARRDRMRRSGNVQARSLKVALRSLQQAPRAPCLVYLDLLHMRMYM